MPLKKWIGAISKKRIKGAKASTEKQKSEKAGSILENEICGKEA